MNWNERRRSLANDRLANLCPRPDGDDTRRSFRPNKLSLFSLPASGVKFTVTADKLRWHRQNSRDCHRGASYRLAFNERRRDKNQPLNFCKEVVVGGGEEEGRGGGGKKAKQKLERLSFIFKMRGGREFTSQGPCINVGTRAVFNQCLLLTRLFTCRWIILRGG